MHVAIRSDASADIGSGHVMRCLALAGELQRNGAHVTMVSRAHSGHLAGFATAAGCRVICLPSRLASPVGATGKYASWLGVSQADDALQTLDALAALGGCDLLVVDHYGLDARWEAAVRPQAKRLMVIDDLADRPHDADVLLDQNLYANMGARYSGLVPFSCKELLGPGYALLRPEFFLARQNIRQRDGLIKRIFVFFGGSDATNETSKALEALVALDLHGIEVDVVIGAANRHHAAIAGLCARLPGARLHRQVSHMARLMAAADLALGAGGSTTWERCALGLPALVVSVAENQVAIANGVDETGAHRHLGLFSDVSAGQLAAAIEEVRGAPADLRKMSQFALALVDARGCERVAIVLKEDI